MEFDRTDYDATAHISEEVKRAQVAAPAAIWIAVVGTGIAGWVYNIVFVLCSGDMADTGDLGVSGYAPAQILWMNVPRGLFYVLWAFICTVAFQVSPLCQNETTTFPLHQTTDETPRGLSLLNLGTGRRYRDARQCSFVPRLLSRQGYPRPWLLCSPRQEQGPCQRRLARHLHRR